MFEVRSSPTHGKGLFAAADIPAGTEIGVFELGVAAPGPDKTYYWGRGLDVVNDLKYANSSMYPTRKGRRFVEAREVTNAKRKDFTLVATRDIQKGEEIFWPYIYYVPRVSNGE